MWIVGEENAVQHVLLRRTAQSVQTAGVAFVVATCNVQPLQVAHVGTRCAVCCLANNSNYCFKCGVNPQSVGEQSYLT